MAQYEIIAPEGAAIELKLQVVVRLVCLRGHDEARTKCIKPVQKAVLVRSIKSKGSMRPNAQELKILRQPIRATHTLRIHFPQWRLQDDHHVTNI